MQKLMFMPVVGSSSAGCAAGVVRLPWGSSGRGVGAQGEGVGGTLDWPGGEAPGYELATRARARASMNEGLARFARDLALARHSTIPAAARSWPTLLRNRPRLPIRG